MEQRDDDFEVNTQPSDITPVELPTDNTPTEPQTEDPQPQLETLKSQLSNITSDSTATTFADPKELGLTMLDRDEYGYFVQIPEEIRTEIEAAQAEFLPVFLDVRSRYAQYPEWGYLNEGNPFVFSPTTIRIMSERLLPSIMKEVTTLYSQGTETGESSERSIHWEESDIEGILNKLLAYESYRLERIMAPRARDHMKETFPNEETLKVKELCTGAGITTALMYEALSETGKDIEFHTVDNSLQSVMCAATLLTLRGIPVRFVLEGDSQEKDFKGVTIYFESALESMQKDGTYHFVYSDNGINYFDETTHYKTVEAMVQRVKPGGLFQDCTLDPTMQVDLSTPSMFKAIFSKKKEPKSGDDEYSIVQKNGVSLVKQFFSPSTTMQYELLNEVRKRLGLGYFWSYLMGAKKAGEITKKLAPKIAQDLRKTGKKVEELTGLQGEYYPKYEDRRLSLTRFFELKLPPQNAVE